MPSRSTADLLPVVQDKVAKFLSLCKGAGINLIITCTYRTFAEQDALYAQGRTVPGGKVTNAKGGESFHNYKLAIDVVPLLNGKPVWGTTGDDLVLWEKIGSLGKDAGLEWAGDWITFKEFPHFQYSGGLTIKDLQAGRFPV